jgi:3-hydroxy-9,10-secoandrosta-1,3,5(10)-triene-9,17-dione monooxygenase
MKNAEFVTKHASETVVEAARKLIPELRAQSVEIDSAGRIPAPVMAKLASERLLSLTIPKSYGGLEVDWETYMDTIVELARGNGSVAWVVAIINTVNWMVAGMYPKSVTDTVFQSPEGCVAVSVVSPRKYKIRKVKGGIHIDYGFWPFNSGIYHANWDALGVPSFDADGKETVLDALALIPSNKVKILNDWNVTAMRGTGSSSVTVEDVFVPDEYIGSVSAAAEGMRTGTDGTPSLRSAFNPIFLLTLAFPVLGMGYGALDIFLEQLKTRKIMYSRYDKQSDAPITHLQLAEASAKLDACRYLLRNAVFEVQEAANAGVPMPRDDRARLKRDVGYSNRTVCEAIDILATASGASLGAISNSFASIWRDIRVAHVHAALAPNTNLETYGRIMAGLDPENPYI